MNRKDEHDRLARESLLRHAYANTDNLAPLDALRSADWLLHRIS
jgi:hypothetical protein